jgi:long-chain acyl-CoA synthetase
MPELFDRLSFGRLVFRGRVFQPAEVNAAIANVAAQLRANIRSRSPFVFLLGPNHIKTIIAYFAIQKAGLIVVPLDPDIRPLELADLENDSRPCAMIRIDPDLPGFDFSREIAFSEAHDERPADADDLSDVCMMVYTAAEDGWYKGALLTRENLLANAQAVVDCDELTSASVTCALAPLYHTYGLQTGLLGPLMARCSLIIEDLSDLQSLKTVVQGIAGHRVTNIYSLPSVLYLLSRVPHVREAMDSVDSVVSGGYKLNESIFRTFLDKTGLAIHEGYGLTEASPICAWHRPRDPIKIESVGRAFSCCEVSVRDAQSLPLPVGRVGEVCIRGANVMKGYYRHPEETRRVLRHGWLHTGDLGRMDADGYLYLTGLAKRMLNVGGKNVYPAELERLLRLQQNIRQAIVYGQESGLGGHAVGVRIELNGNGNGSREAVRQWYIENLSRFKMSRRIEFL